MKYIDLHTHQPINHNHTQIVQRYTTDNSFDSTFSIGLHPWQVESETFKFKLQALEKIASRENCLAIGECGLDKICKNDFETQLLAFETQIEIAKRQNKPLIIHCVRAFQEVYSKLKAHKFKLPVIFHGYSGNFNIIEQFKDMNCYYSFGANLFKNNIKTIESLKNISKEKLFLETDDSKLEIQHIYNFAKNILDVKEEDLAKQINCNFKKVFKHNTY